MDTETYVKIYADLYYPKQVEPNTLTLEEIRQISIKVPGKEFKHPQTWMPPISAIKQLAKLVQCQIAYFLTVLNPQASLPNFISIGCLEKRKDGTTWYNLGAESHVDNKETLLTIPEKDLAEKLKSLSTKQSRKSCKRRQDETPQKGKPTKRQPLMSTPK